MDIPVHPLLVHVPLGLAVVVPLIALITAVAIWRGWLSWRAWGIVVVLQAILFGGAFVAAEEGEEDEEVVEDIVPHEAMELHEEAGHQLVYGAGVALALVVLAGVVPSRKPRGWLTAVAVVGTLAVAGLAVRAGKAGGELVYVHGAADAHREGHGPAAVEGHDD